VVKFHVMGYNTNQATLLDRQIRRYDPATEGQSQLEASAEEDTICVTLGTLIKRRLGRCIEP